MLIFTDFDNILIINTRDVEWRVTRYVQQLSIVLSNNHIYYRPNYMALSQDNIQSPGTGTELAGKIWSGFLGNYNWTQ
jgi:hypothetical protein